MNADGLVKQESVAFYREHGYWIAPKLLSDEELDITSRPVTPIAIEPGSWWVEDPAATFPMHGWMDVDDGHRGLAVIAEGFTNSRSMPSSSMRNNSTQLTITDADDVRVFHDG